VTSAVIRKPIPALRITQKCCGHLKNIENALKTKKVLYGKENDYSIKGGHHFLSI
jgi:hypothetical protein